MPRIRSRSSRSGSALVSTPKGLNAVSKRLARQPLVAFDTEFLWERTYSPRLGLIQVADEERTWLVDPLALSPEAMRPLLDLLVSPETLKVAHAIDQDQMCLHCSYGIVAEPVLDTSIAAALLGMGDQISLAAMLEKVVRVRLAKGYSRTNWLKRPLSPQMREYAAEDVSHLAKAAKVLQARLRKLAREDWALELSSRHGDFAKAHFEPDLLARRIAEARRLDRRTFGVLRELIAWREGEASRRDLPRKWLAHDKTLVKLASASPTTERQLADFRGLGISSKPGGGARILQAIRKGTRDPVDGYVRPKRKKQPTPKESAALVVLRCFLNALAADNNLPVRMLVESDRMVELLRGQFNSADDLGKSGILEDRVVDLVGQDLVEILNGRRGLRLVNGVATQQRT